MSKDDVWKSKNLVEPIIPGTDYTIPKIKFTVDLDETIRLLINKQRTSEAI